MKGNYLAVLLICMINLIYSQNWEEYYNLSEESFDNGKLYNAEYNGLLALIEVKNNVGYDHENYNKCLTNLINIYTHFDVNEEVYELNADSLTNVNINIYTNNFNKKDVKLLTLLKTVSETFSKNFNYKKAIELQLRSYQMILDNVYEKDEYFTLYSDFFDNLYNTQDENNYNLATSIYETQLKNLTNYKINHFNHLDIVSRVYARINEVNKNKNVLLLTEKIYTKLKGEKSDNFVSLYLNVGNMYEDFNSKLEFYELAYERFKNLQKSEVGNILVSNVFESLSTSNFFLEKYDTALKYDLESLHYLTDFNLLSAKYRIVQSYYKLEKKVLAHKFIEELNLEINKLSKQSDQYKIYKTKLVYIYIENNDYKPTIPIIKDIISIYSKDNDENIYNLNYYKFYLSQSYYHIGETQKAKQIINNIDDEKIYSDIAEKFNAFKKMVNLN